MTDYNKIQDLEGVTGEELFRESGEAYEKQVKLAVKKINNTIKKIKSGDNEEINIFMRMIFEKNKEGYKNNPHKFQEEIIEWLKKYIAYIKGDLGNDSENFLEDDYEFIFEKFEEHFNKLIYFGGVNPFEKQMKEQEYSELEKKYSGVIGWLKSTVSGILNKNN